MENTTYKRRNYFIDKKFQLMFMMRFSVLVLIGGMLTIAFIYLLGMQSKTVAIQNSRVIVKTTADFILPLLIQAVIAVTIIVGITTGILTLLVSHKISGPLYRFKKVLEALEQGDFSSEFHIRLADQFHELADEINGMIRNTKQKLSGIKNNVVSLKQKLDSLNENDFPGDKRAALTELKKLADEINTLVSYFKL